MPDVIRRAVQLQVQGGDVFVQDVTIAGKKAEAALGAVGSGADKASAGLHGTGEAAAGLSGAMRQHMTQAGDDVNRLFDSINSGRSVLTALEIEVPKILDVFGSPWLTAAGIVVGATAAIGGSYLSLSTYQEKLAAASETDIKALEGFTKAFEVHLNTVAGATAAYGSFTAAQNDLVKVNLEQSIKDQTAAIENSQKILDRMVAAQASQASFKGTESAVPGIGMLNINGSGNKPIDIDTDPAQAKIAALSQKVLDLWVAYDSGKAPLSEFIAALNEQANATALTEVGARGETAAIIDQLDKVEAAKRALELYTAQYHLFQSLLGDTSAFKTADELALTHARALEMAVQEISKGSVEELRIAGEQAAEILERTGRIDLADRLRTHVQSQINELTKSGQEEADRNAIILRVGVDTGEAGKLFSELKTAQERMGSSFAEQSQRIRDAAKVINDQPGSLKISAEAVEAVIARLGQTYARTAAEDQKLRQEHELMAKGFTQEQADAAIQLSKNVNINLEGRNKLESDLNTLLATRAGLKAPEDAPQRANLDQEILQTKQKIADLDQKDNDKIDSIIGANQKILDQLKAQVEFKSGGITQEDIAQAGIVARDKINTNLGPNATQGDIADAKAQADAAQAAGEAAKYEAFWTQANADVTKVMDDERKVATDLYNKLLPPQEKYAEQLEKLAPLNDNTAEGQERYNKAVAALKALQPILEKQAQLRERQIELDRLQSSQNPLDWAKAGLTEIAFEAEDTGKTVSGLIKSGFDTENHAFFEMVSGQKQGWADMKAGALSFVATLGEVAQKELIVMLITKSLGFITGGFGFGGGGTAAMQTTGGGIIQSSDIMNVYDAHSGGQVGQSASLPRKMSTAAIPYLPRFHSGSLAHDERVVVVQTGEEILNRQQSREYRRVISSAPRYHEGGMVGDAGPVPRGTGSAAPTIIYSPTHNTYISGINDPSVVDGLVRASSAKANADFVREVRNNPDFRRHMGAG